MMPKLDDILQIHLESLEEGAALDSVLAGLPEGLANLSPLIQLAASIREHPIPEPNLSDSLVRDVRASMKAAEAPWIGWREFFERIVSLSGYRLGGAVMTAGLLIISLLSFGFWFGRTRDERRVSLIEVVGQVEVTSGESTKDWQGVSNGQQIKEGQRIRTGVDGTATLLFFDGSRAVLDSNTDLALVNIGGNDQKGLIVSIYQYKGDTAHSVVPFDGEKSVYRIDTPTGAANVYGTTFRVAVLEDNVTRFSVDTGDVLVEAQNQQVSLSAGQATVVQANQPLKAPAYQFSLDGILAENDQNKWVVDGVAFLVAQDTILKGSPKVGDFVEVDGRVLMGGTWVADMIEIAGKIQPKATFTGILQSVGSEWTISRVNVLVDRDTRIDPDLSIGDPVQVSFIVLDDGRWKALANISLVEKPQETPSIPLDDDFTPTPTSTPQPKDSLEPTDPLEPSDTPEPEESATPTATWAPENIAITQDTPTPDNDDDPSDDPGDDDPGDDDPVNDDDDDPGNDDPGDDDDDDPGDDDPGDDDPGKGKRDGADDDQGDDDDGND